MKYNVVWTPVVEGMLADVWLSAVNRNEITRASDSIDRALELSPLKFGKPLESSVHRYAVVVPLGVEFEVIEDDKKVIVHAVWEVS